MTVAEDFLSFIQAQKQLSTTHRPMRMLLAFPGGVRDDVLLPQRVTGIETICGGFTYTVLALSTSAELPLKEFIALPAEIQFVTDRADIRRLCGIVSEASVGNSDGGVASYQLVIRDAFAFLEKRVNSRIFRTMSELEVIDVLLSEWRQNNSVVAGCLDFEIDQVLLSRRLPQREMICQHNESDADFARRLLKRRGIAWFFRAGAASAQAARSEPTWPCHTLVLFDDAYSLKRNAAGTVRFHRDDGTEQRDTITSWSGIRKLQPGQVGRYSWDYRQPDSRTFMIAHVLGQSDQGATGNKFAASLDDYMVEMPHMGNDYEDYCALGEVRMARHDYETKCFHGESSVRDLCVGEYLSLTGHPEIDTHPVEGRDFVITELRVLAINNLPSNLAEKAERLFDRNRWGGERPQAVAGMADAGTRLRSRNEFTAVRRGIPIVPAYDPRTDLPQMQIQSALVVGPEGEEVYCDQMGRVKIRFPAMRASDHQHAGGIGASGTDADSAWVRVASNWAGNGPGSQRQCGAIGLPRVGSEVLVAFLGGDPDKPVIVGQVYNEMAVPPGISEAGELPGNRYLSGLRSREVGGSRANRLSLDDTPGQISAQLKCDHGHSELNLGWLTQPRAGGNGEPRGEGAELRSDRSVSVRGGQGVLISATAGGANGPQLERGELVGMVEVFLSVAEELAKLATLHEGGNTDGPHLPRLLDKLRQWDVGTNVSAGSQQSSPVIAASAPGGIVVASQDSLALGAESKIDIVSVGQTEISSGKDISVRAAHSINLFAHQLGMKLIAATGNVAIQAHNGDIELTTPGRIKLHAGQGIELQAPEVKIVAQGAQADFGGGAITQQTSGPHAIKSSSFAHTQPGGANPPGVTFPSSGVEADERLVLFHQSTGKPIAGRRYRLDLEDGRVISGVTDDQGRTELVTSNAMGKVDFTIFPPDQQSET